MSRRSIPLIIALTVAVIALAMVLDLLAPIGSWGVGMITVFDLGGRRTTDLPRAVRALAAVAALAGYGLLLRYLAADRFATLTRALASASGRLTRYGVSGAAAAVLLVALTLLSAISVIAGPLVPVIGLGLAVAALTGQVALAQPLGQRLRARAGDHEPGMAADLLTGVLAIVIAALVPYLGTIALAATWLVGLGALASTRFGALDEWVDESCELRIEN